MDQPTKAKTCPCGTPIIIQQLSNLSTPQAEQPAGQIIGVLDFSIERGNDLTKSPLPPSCFLCHGLSLHKKAFSLLGISLSKWAKASWGAVTPLGL